MYMYNYNLCLFFTIILVVFLTKFSLPSPCLEYLVVNVVLFNKIVLFSNYIVFYCCSNNCYISLLFILIG